MRKIVIVFILIVFMATDLKSQSGRQLNLFGKNIINEKPINLNEGAILYQTRGITINNNRSVIINKPSSDFNTYIQEILTFVRKRNSEDDRINEILNENDSLKTVNAEIREINQRYLEEISANQKFILDLELYISSIINSNDSLMKLIEGAKGRILLANQLYKDFQVFELKGELGFQFTKEEAKNRNYLLDSEFSEGLVKVERGGKIGFVDTNRRIVIGFKYDSAGHFSSDVAPVKRGKYWYYISKTGKPVLHLPDSLKQATPFNKGFAVVNYYNRKDFGLSYNAPSDGNEMRHEDRDTEVIDINGNSKVGVLSSFRIVDNNYLLLQRSPRWSLVKWNNMELITPFVADEIQKLGHKEVGYYFKLLTDYEGSALVDYVKNDTIIFNDDYTDFGKISESGLLWVKKGRDYEAEYAFYNLFDPDPWGSQFGYTNVSTFVYGLAKVQQNRGDLYKVIDKYNREILPLQFHDIRILEEDIIGNYLYLGKSSKAKFDHEGNCVTGCVRYQKKLKN